MRIKKIVLFLVCVFWVIISSSQTVNYGPGPGGSGPIPCDASVPLFQVDFTGSPGGQQTFNSNVRIGECCGNGNDCI